MGPGQMVLLRPAKALPQLASLLDVYWHDSAAGSSRCFGEQHSEYSLTVLESDELVGYRLACCCDPIREGRFL